MDRTAEVGAVPFGVGLEDGSSACAVPTHGPPSLSRPPLAPRGFLYQAPDFRGGSPWGQVPPPFSLLTSLGLERVTLSQFHLSEPQKSLPL